MISTPPTGFHPLDASCAKTFCARNMLAAASKLKVIPCADFIYSRLSCHPLVHVPCHSQPIEKTDESAMTVCMKTTEVVLLSHLRGRRFWPFYRAAIAASSAASRPMRSSANVCGAEIAGSSSGGSLSFIRRKYLVLNCTASFEFGSVMIPSSP